MVGGATTNRPLSRRAPQVGAVSKTWRNEQAGPESGSGIASFDARPGQSIYDVGPGEATVRSKTPPEDRRARKRRLDGDTGCNGLDRAEQLGRRARRRERHDHIAPLPIVIVWPARDRDVAKIPGRFGHEGICATHGESAWRRTA